MIYFVMVFLGLGVASFGVMVAGLFWGGFGVTTLVKRAGLMAVVWVAFGVGLHYLYTGSASFRAGLPASVLNLDLRRSGYGLTAMSELVRRAEAGATGRDDWARTTEVLLSHEWWAGYVDDGLYDNDNFNFKAYGESARTGDAVQVVRRWFGFLIGEEALDEETFGRWLQVDPPGIFEIPDEVEAGGNALAITVRYGREWNAEAGLPYEISKMGFDEIRIDGKVVPFEVTEGSSSEAARGRYAQRVVWFIGGLPQPGKDAAGREEVVEVRYRLSAEPGGFADVGPLVWRKAVRVR